MGAATPTFEPFDGSYVTVILVCVCISSYVYV